MPHLDTSTWITTVLSSTITLFILMQLNISSQDFPQNPTNKTLNFMKTENP